MATAPQDLGDFFAKKKVKKAKALNLNNASTDKKAEDKKDVKDKEEEGWEDEQVVAEQLKANIAGKLTREEDKKEEEVTTAAWGTARSKADTNLSDKKYPTLAKSIQSSNINLDNGEAKVNIKTDRNAFAALENNDVDEEEEAAKRPKEIKPAMVSKPKGEREKVTIQREMDKYSVQKEVGRKNAAEGPRRKDASADGADSGDEETDGKPDPVEEGKDLQKGKKDAKGAQQVQETTQMIEIEEDLQILADQAAAKKKYDNRRKLERKPLPPSEMEEERRSKPPAAQRKKKFAYVEEEEKPKLAVWEGD